MKNGLERKRWETPVLEKIEISRTQNCGAQSPGSPGNNKNADPAENGKCGSGPSS